MRIKLVKGDTGADVRELQARLISAGYSVERDGWFGDNTEAAVREFQRRVGLVADGIAGPKTLATLQLGKKPNRLLAQADIDSAAEALGVQVAALMAVNEVESRGEGFLVGNPVVLFERHVMYQRLADAGQDADGLVSRYPDLVNRKRGGYKGGAQEWYRLSLARQIEQPIANESASWGAFQIMGYHWRALDYASIGDFVAAMSRNEAAHLDAFVRFILADANLHKALKGRKWADFAKGYNGPAYKANLYDVKLQRAYERHAAAEKVPA
jgi:hypothetical protein